MAEVNWLYATFHLLLKGWIYFKFKSAKDINVILKHMLLWGPLSLVLDRWKPSFDPPRKMMVTQHLWVLIIGLPFEYWNKKALTSIGNWIKKFLALKENFWDLVKKSWLGFWWKWTLGMGYRN